MTTALTPEQQAALDRLAHGDPPMWAVVHRDGYTHCMMCDEARADQYAAQQRAIRVRLWAADAGVHPGVKT